MADANVARALYLKATGQWTQPAVKIATKIEILPDGTEVKSEHIVPYTEHFPPDTAAAFIWLKNRRPDLWRDKKEIHETSERKEQVTVELSPRAQQHIAELKALLFRDDDQSYLGAAEASPAGGEANGARKRTGATTH